MAALRAGRRALALHRVRGQGFANMFFGARTAAGLSNDSLPGSYPKNPEEVAAAAKKYNMSIHDYKAHPDEGMGFGDYPQLPERSQHERDPWYEWDHPDLRRNWGEPMHWDFDMFIRNRVDTSPSPMDWRTMSGTLLGFVGLMLFMFYIGEVFPAYQPVAPKQYPYNNLYLECGGDPEKAPEEVKHYKI